LTRPNVTRESITISKEIAKNSNQLVLPNIINDYLTACPHQGDNYFPERIHWYTALKKLHQLSNTSGWSWHDLRRTLSTNMARWEIAPPDVVEAILNHTTGSRNKIQRVYDRHNRFPQMKRALTAYRERLQTLREKSLSG
jgi:HD superfamily phosphohydrolase YqeK